MTYFRVTNRLGAVLAVASVLLIEGMAPASQGRPPAVTAETIKGRWEGINFDEPRLFLLRICGAENSFVTQSHGAPGHTHAYVYRSRSLSVAKGEFVLDVVGESGERLEIRARGEATHEGGRMHGKVTRWAPDGSPVVSSVDFFKEKEGYTNRLRELVATAERTESAERPSDSKRPKSKDSTPSP